MKTLRAALLILGSLFCIADTPAAADTIQIHLTGLDFTYDGSQIHDAASPAIGDADPSEADELATIAFFLDEVLVGTLNTGPELKFYADLLIPGVSGLPADGGTIITSGDGESLGLELFGVTGGESPTTSELLALNVGQFTVNYTVFDDPISIELAMAAGPASQLLEQALPFGLAFNPDDEISILVSSVDLSNVTPEGAYLTGFDAFGTGEIAGAVIPEPSTCVLLACGAMTLLVSLIRRRSA